MSKAVLLQINYNTTMANPLHDEFDWKEKYQGPKPTQSQTLWI